MKSHFLVILPLFLTLSSKSQNLVMNPSFEHYKSCPEDFTRKQLKLKEGAQGVIGTPDYFHSCSKAFSTHRNPFGDQMPYRGDAYVGIVVTTYHREECDKREFIEMKLSEELAAGSKYRFSMYVSLADRSGYYTDQLGVKFATDRFPTKEIKANLLEQQDLNNDYQNFLTDTSGWKEISGIYNAKGGERFLLIGNFAQCNQTSRKALVPNKGDKVVTNMKRKYLDDQKAYPFKIYNTAYYFVDMVALTPHTENDSIDYLSQEEACNDLDDLDLGGQRNLLYDPEFSLNSDDVNPYWKNASAGTPDFVKNKTGLYLFSDLNEDNREYITSELKEQIEPCYKYHYEMSVRRNKDYRYAVDQIGIAFTDSLYTQDDRLVFPLDFDFVSPKSKIIEVSDSWITLCGTFSPSKCAKYIIIGNFANDDQTIIMPMEDSEKDGPYAYYFIDKLGLYREEITPGCNVECEGDEPIVQKDTAIDRTVIQEKLIVYFDTYSTRVKSIDHEQIKRFAEALQNDNSLSLMVEGHADSSGNDELNENLSLKRAESLRDLLLEKGIHRNRIKVLHFGSKRPITDNGTQIGRQRNRRVEVYLD